MATPPSDAETPVARGLRRRELLKLSSAGAAALGAAALFNLTSAEAQTMSNDWDKTFPKSAKVDHRKVAFRNRYGITLAGDLYLPKGRAGERLAALALSGPFGAVKEQSSGLYAQAMAERGFAALAFDPSYTGESGGEPRNVASPDINTEDFSAAVDFLGLQAEVDRERIGIIGICGWGGMALNAAAVDKRVKAVATSTMYDMTRVMSKGYNDSVTLEQRTRTLEQLSRQRWEDAEKGAPAYQPPLQRAEGRRGPVPGRLPRLLHDEARLSSTGGQLRERLDGHDAAVVHEHAAPDLHQGDLAASGPADPRGKGPLALLQRNRLCGRGRAEGTPDRPQRQPRRSLRQDGRDPVRQARGVLHPASGVMETPSGRKA